MRGEANSEQNGTENDSKSKTFFHLLLWIIYLNSVFSFSFSFIIHQSILNTILHKYTTPKYIQNTALHKNNKLKLKITEKVLYMIVFKID